MRIGIFGGTFDPFTEAHAAVVNELLAKHLVDRVIIAPTIVDWHREGKTPWLNDDQKLDIINTVLEAKRLFVAAVEVWTNDLKLREFCRGNPVLEEQYVKSRRFIDTLIEIIENQDSNSAGRERNEYYVVIGSDSYAMFKSWGMWQEILKLAKLIVVDNRNGIKIEDDPLVLCTKLVIDEKLASVSSSKIRAEWMSKGFETYKDWLSKNKIDKLLHTPIFDVIADKEAPNNPGLKPIKVNAPDWVTIIVEKDGKFLVEKQFRYGSNCEIEEFPCGMVEKSELASDAAARELEEETGYKISAQTLMHLGSVNPNSAFMTNMMHYFYVNLDHVDYEIVSQRLDTHEKITFSWKDKDKFIAETMEKISSGIQVPAMLLTAFKLYDEKVKQADLATEIPVEDIEALFDEAGAEAEDDYEYREMVDKPSDEHY